MWQQTLDHNGDGLIDYNDKLTYDEILASIDTVSTGGHNDWRLPTIKEQYSLIMYSGEDVSGFSGTDTSSLIPFINTDYFGYNYGDTSAGERIIDVQFASTNKFVGNTAMVFGVNFADGRIKGYGTTMMGQAKVFNYLLVRGNATYGKNEFTENSDETISDTATKLMWTQDDAGVKLDWKNALLYAENYELAGYTDWRLPNVKELQGIVDYSYSPSATNSANIGPAINPLFSCTPITNEAGNSDYGYYWTGTSANFTSGEPYYYAWYVAFGMAVNGNGEDFHGAGAVRFDTKEENGPNGEGGERYYNYVRLVRDIN